MLPLISYNPWTDMKTGGASLALVRKAVSDYGFIGVKIYPPMGYFPYGNANAMPPVKSDKPRPSDLHELDRRLCDFFDLCAELKVPVIAHTGQSMGRDDASDRYDMFGGPRGWRSLLARSMKGRQVPIIQAGHFGGDTTNSGADGSNWSAVFAGMMAEAKGGKLYADVGYWTAPTGNEYDPKCEGLRGRVGCALKINPAAKSRIMYGTDWFMTSKEPNWNEYPANISLALGDLVGRDELFAKNALDCYGLGENGDNVVRLQSRFKNAGIVAPAWLGSAIR